MTEAYQFIKEEYIKEIKITGKYYIHKKTGARVVILPCADKNKTFTIGFRTTPQDDTGVAHILEHSTLCGSKKFPVKDPFVELLKSSLNTYLNASTYPDKTIYPCASCNDKDFKNLMEVYLDAVFFPQVYSKKEIFMQEGWHYHLENVDDEITYNGVVYNEMKGALSSVSSICSRASYHVAYPDTPYSVESGGDPAAIPNLTYEDFVKFHDKYYSPSNCYIVLYGNCDMEERLDWIDKEYLSKFDKIDFDSSIAYQGDYENELISYIQYPIDENEELENNNYYVYNLLFPDYKEIKTLIALSVAANAMIQKDTSVIKKRILDEGLCVDVDSYVETELQQGLLSVTLIKAKNGALDQLKTILSEEFAKFAKDGISAKTLRGILKRRLFKLKEANYGDSPRGLVYTTQMFTTWLYNDDMPFDALKLEDIYNELIQDTETDYFKELVNKYFVNNKNVSYVVCTPSKTLNEEKETSTKEKLALYKKSLSNEELEDLVKTTKELIDYQATPSTKEELDTLPKLKISDIIPEETFVVNEEKEINGVKVYEHNVDTKGISYFSLYFDVHNIDEATLKTLPGLMIMLGAIDTEKYSLQEIDELTDEFIGTWSLDNFINTDMDKNLKFYLRIYASYLYGNDSYAFDLYDQILHHTKFEDKKRIREVLSQWVVSNEQKMIRSGHATAIGRAISYFNESAYYTETQSGYLAYEYIKNLVDNFDELIDQEIESWKNILSKVFGKNNLLVSYTGHDDNFYFELDKFIDTLNEYEFDESMKFKYSPCILNEGFTIPAGVQYCARVGQFDPSEYNGAFKVFLMALKYDYLWNKVRVLGGAYGVMSNLNEKGIGYFVSYRDPKLSETYDVYNKVLEYIDTFNPTDDELTQYIIGAIGEFDPPMDELDIASFSMTCILRNRNPKDFDKIREEILTANCESIKKVKKVFEEIFLTDAICTVGNTEKIEQNKHLFKSIKPLIK